MADKNVVFIRKGGRVIPIRKDRLKNQAKAGAVAGAIHHTGVQLLNTKFKKAKIAGAAAILGGASIGIYKEVQAIGDAFKVGKEAGFMAGVGEYAKQSLSRFGGSIAGAAGAKVALSSTAKGMKSLANNVKAKRSAKKVSGLLPGKAY